MSCDELSFELAFCRDHKAVLSAHANHEKAHNKRIRFKESVDRSAAVIMQIDFLTNMGSGSCYIVLAACFIRI